MQTSDWRSWLGRLELLLVQYETLEPTSVSGGRESNELGEL